jgi:DNA polymerase-4
LHADLDSFFASVEQRDTPSLRGRAVIVGGGVALAASYEAKACGVRSGMSRSVWRPMCPHAVVVPPRMDAYLQASRDVFAVFDDTTPLVEPMSVDEAFLDVRGLLRVSGAPELIAQRLRAQVREQVGLCITVGVARTKFLAKVASGVAKPDGLLVVAPDHELDFLWPLPVERLWGVGRVTAQKLHDRGIYTVAEVAALEPAWLTAMLGPAAGRHVHALAHNLDPRAVQPGRRSRSVGGQRAIGRGPHSDAELDVVLLTLVDRVCRRLRAGNRVCRTVVLRLRTDEFVKLSRSHSFDHSTADTSDVVLAARTLLVTAFASIPPQRITLVGVSLAGLVAAEPRQLELPLAAERGLDVAVDAVRARFGSSAVTRGVLVGRSPGIEMPTLDYRQVT